VIKRRSSAMVYEHGRLVWAFRVLASKPGVVDEVLLVRIYKSHPLEANLGDGKVIKYFIVAQRNRQDHGPVVNMQYFEKLVAIDGLPPSKGNSVVGILEKVFALGFQQRLKVKGESLKVGDETLNEYMRALAEVAEAHKLNLGPTKQVLRNVYRWAVWCGERWKNIKPA